MLQGISYADLFFPLSQSTLASSSVWPQGGSSDEMFTVMLMDHFFQAVNTINLIKCIIIIIIISSSSSSSSSSSNLFYFTIFLCLKLET